MIVNLQTVAVKARWTISLLDYISFYLHFQYLDFTCAIMQLLNQWNLSKIINLTFFITNNYVEDHRPLFLAVHRVKYWTRKTKFSGSYDKITILAYSYHHFLELSGIKSLKVPSKNFRMIFWKLHITANIGLGSMSYTPNES